MLPQPLNSSAISNDKLVDTWAKLKVYDLIDVILLEGAIRNVQLREIGTIGYRWHMTKTSKHKSTTQHRKFKKWTTWASPKVRCSRRESSSWVVKIHRVQYTYLPVACPYVAHKGNYWLSSVLKLIFVCIRNLVFMHNSSISINIWFIEI